MNLKTGELLKKDPKLAACELFKGESLKEAQLSAIIMFKDKLSSDEFAGLLGKMTFNSVCIHLNGISNEKQPPILTMILLKSINRKH